MKIIFTSLNIRTALLLRVACGVRIVNKAFEMEMGGPSEDPSCPCAVPRHFFCTSGRYVSARTRYQARTSVLSMQYEKSKKRSGSRIIGISFVSLGGS